MDFMEIDCLEYDDLFYCDTNKYLTDDSQESCEETTHATEVGLCTTTDSWTKTLELLSKKIDNVFARVIGRHREICETRENFRVLIESHKSSDPLYIDLNSLSARLLENGSYQAQFLVPVTEGISGTYFLIDNTGAPQCVIKPFDEEAGCLNNPKSFDRITQNYSIRDYVALYHSAMREVLAYQVALKIGIDSLVPETVLAIIQADQFHDYSEKIAGEELQQYLNQCGPVDREKLCSVQRYVLNSKPLGDLLDDLEATDLGLAEIAARFDQSDFEDANILLWVTYDTDGHLWNFLAYPKAMDAMGNEIFGIKKIDNGLAFPNKNRQLRNQLIKLDNAQRQLSESAKAKISNIDIDVLADQFRLYGLASAIPALRERIVFLQRIIHFPEVTLRMINSAMSRVTELI